MVKRWKGLAIALAIIMGLLVLRLAYIQVLGHEDLYEAASMQQQITLEGADKRGLIYDRNGEVLAGAYQEYIYILEEDKVDGETLNAFSYLGAEEVPNEGNIYRVFTSGLYDKEIGDRLINNSEAFILEAGRRYSENQPAVHMIGYVNPKDSSGASGLELKYDDELSQYSKKISANADVKGNLLQGYGLKVTSESDNDAYIKTGITTTLDLSLQKEVEQCLADLSKNGAVVVTDIDGEILAAASTPVYEPGSIDEYMESNNGELINKVTQGEYPPGSVFKIVVAAAALENGVSTDEIFKCKGAERINGKSVKCETGGEKGHGKITLEEAFAVSCNCAFIQLGECLGPEVIIQTAASLGLGQQVLEGYPEEKAGNLMTIQQSRGAAIANLSIGQGETQVTPLQVAKLTSIIAADGEYRDLYIVGEDQKNEPRQCISAETASKICEMMVRTTESGTGSAMALDVTAGTKTGSAESTQGGIEVVHGWITGFIPAEDPEYVITVFIEDGKSGRSSAGPVFEKIANFMEEDGMLEYEVGI